MEYEDQLPAVLDGWPAVAVESRRPVLIAWRSIGDAGEESSAWGHVWDVAPLWRGQSALWVRTLLQDEPSAYGATVLVAVASRRQPCGVAGRGGRRRGRWIEQGEAWSDWAMRDWQRKEASRPAPTVIRSRLTVEDDVIARGWQDNPLSVLVFERSRERLVRS
jgi:hypothetical protein